MVSRFEKYIKHIFLVVNCTKEDLDALSNSRTDVTLLGYNNLLTYGTTYKYICSYLNFLFYVLFWRYECNEDGKSFEDSTTGNFSKYLLATCEADGSWNISSVQPPCECKYILILSVLNFNFRFPLYWPSDSGQFTQAKACLELYLSTSSWGDRDLCL